MCEDEVGATDDANEDEVEGAKAVVQRAFVSASYSSGSSGGSGSSSGGSSGSSSGGSSGSGSGSSGGIAPVGSAHRVVAGLLRQSPAGFAHAGLPEEDVSVP